MKITVEPILFLFMLVFMLNIAVFQDMIYVKVCIQNFNSSICEQLDLPENKPQLDKVQAETSYWIMHSHLSFTIPTLMVTAYLGAWTDEFSKKFPLFIPSIGGIVTMLIHIVMSSNWYSPLWLSVISNAVGGAFGGYVSSVAACFSYISTITDDKTRMSRFAVAESMIYLGGTIGPLGSAVLLPIIGHSYIFLLCLICYSILIVYTCLFIDEIKPESSGKKKKIWVVKYFGTRHLSNFIKTPFVSRPNKGRAVLLVLLVAFFVDMVTMNGTRNITYLFMKDNPIYMNYRTYGYLVAAQNGLSTFLLIVSYFLTKRWFVSDSTIAIFGLVTKALSLVVLGVSTTKEMTYLYPLLAAPSCLIIPAVTSALSKSVDPTEQGKIMANVSAWDNISVMVASMIYSSLYPLTREINQKGILLHSSAVFSLLIVIIYMWVYYQVDHSPRRKSIENSSKKGTEEQMNKLP